MQSYISARLFFLPDVEELPAASTTSLNHLCLPARDGQVQTALPGRVQRSSQWLRMEVADNFLCPIPSTVCQPLCFVVLHLGLHLQTWQIQPQWPRKVALHHACGPCAREDQRGEAEDFSRGKRLQTAFWEESRAQIYICGPKLRIMGKPKCCKSKICSVSTLHPLLYHRIAKSPLWW